jgi:hypothetical protein
MKKKPAPKKKTIKGTAPAKKPSSSATTEAKPTPQVDFFKEYTAAYNVLFGTELYNNPPTVDSLAMVAATIYKGETMSPRDAVGVALAIIDESKRAIRLIDSVDGNIARERKDEREKRFSYSEGLKKITGQKRKDRAVEIFQDILEAWLKTTDAYYFSDNQPELLRKMLSCSISTHEKRGFTGEEIENFQVCLKKLKKNL